MLRTAVLKLLLESYFDITLCSFINFVALYQAEGWEEFQEYFTGFSNILNSCVALIGTTLALVFPLWV